tara:strand:- start:1101 stop:1589 length:489 start_codon:yes stop_codon:yes gene_type:complete
MQVIDDALDREYFEHLEKQMLHQNRFKWLFQEKVATLEDDPNDEQFYFICSFYHHLMVEDDFYYELKPLFDALGVKALIRARAIMYMNQGKLIKHKPHVDFEYSHNAALLYINTNNGYTGMMNDDKVESVENRILLHDGSIPHYSTTCTDTCKRIVLAVNYF